MCYHMLSCVWGMERQFNPRDSLNIVVWQVCILTPHQPVAPSFLTAFKDYVIQLKDNPHFLPRYVSIWVSVDDAILKAKGTNRFIVC